MRTQGDRGAAAASGELSRAAIAILLIAACAAAALACATGTTRDLGDDHEVADAVPREDGAAPREDGGMLTKLPFDSIYASAQSGVSTPWREVVRTPDAWAAAWDRIAGDRSPELPRPDIDFERFMLIAAGLGTRPSGGYAVRIAGIESAPDVLTVTIEELAPGVGCIATTALTAPVIVVRAARADGEARFAAQTRERACD
jgi:hypothetical protein